MGLHTRLLVLAIGSVVLASLGRCSINVPAVGDDPGYVHQGDLNLGVLTPVRLYSSTCTCDKGVWNYGFQWLEAYRYALEQVNSRTDLLPNITLGAQIYDTCMKDTTALAKTMQFIPQEFLTGGGNVSNEYIIEEPGEDIVGVVGDALSTTVAVTAKLLQQFYIAQVSSVASSDDFSNKVNFPYLLHLSPPDQYQVDAIIDILLHFKWNYISLIVTEGPYGQNARRRLEKLAQAKSICIAFAKVLNRDMTSSEIDHVAEGITNDKKARVVVLFTNSDRLGKELVTKVTDMVKDHFIWINSDGTTNDLSGMEDGVVGSFGLSVAVREDDAFEAHLRSVKMSSLTRYPEPWWKPYWSDLFSCGWKNCTKMNCSEFASHAIGDSPVYEGFHNSLLIDNIYVFAHALHDVINESCPGAFGCKSLLKNCICRKTLFKRLINTSFVGASGVVRFDKNGNGVRPYTIKQWQSLGSSFGYKSVGLWNGTAQTLSIDNPLQWIACNKTVPSSVCSSPCKDDEVKITKAQRCCWECRKCRPNEKLAMNRTRCLECPSLHWPDKTGQHCSVIPPAYLEWTHPLALILVLCVVCMLVGCLATIAVYIRHRNDRLIKACSMYQSMLIVAGIAVCNVTTLVMFAKPTRTVCYTQRLALGLCYSLVYAPLLLRCIHINRIFSADRKGNRAPMLTGPLVNFGFSCFVVLGQAVISTGTAIIYPPDAVMRQHPALIESRVELLCDLPVFSLIIPLSYNILLVLLATIFGFRSRQLPNNFNESKHIFLSVCATMFLWIAFLPTYFVTSEAFHKTLLLGLAPLLSSAVIALCLFVPRIYALYYVDKDEIVVFTAATVSVNSVHPSDDDQKW